MKTKIFGLFALSIFALVLFAGFASAAALTLTNTSVIPITANPGDAITVEFNITHGGLVENNFTLNWSSTGSEWTTLPTLNSINKSETKSDSAVLTIPSDASGTFSTELKVKAYENGSYYSIYSLPISLNIIPVSLIHPEEIQACNLTGTPTEFEIRKIDFTNNGLQYGSFGQDDEWFPFEEIEVEIRIENDLKDIDIDNIEVEWGLWDTVDSEWVIEPIDEKDFDLKDGDIETLIVTFKIDDDLDVDLDQLSDQEDRYRFYVTATGEMDTSGTPEICAFDSKDVSIVIERDFVILDNIDMPETVQCGENVQITADVWNIGDRDQNDVYVLIKSNELGINNEKIEIGDIDAFDNAPFNFDFQVPSDAEEKTYSIRFTVYDDDNDVYENDYDEDESVFSVFLKVEGNCGVITDVLISASLESEARAGKEMVIKATITNQGGELQTFTINAAEFAAWADLISQDQNILVLNAGQSRDVLFTFDVKRDASGSQTFFIELVSDDDVTRQLVSVNVESARPFLGITGFVTTDNAYLWGIGILNIIIIVIIIIVAVRIARRK